MNELKKKQIPSTTSPYTKNKINLNSESTSTIEIKSIIKNLTLNVSKPVQKYYK